MKIIVENFQFNLIFLFKKFVNGANKYTYTLSNKKFKNFFFFKELDKYIYFYSITFCGANIVFFLLFLHGDKFAILNKIETLN